MGAEKRITNNIMQCNRYLMISTQIMAPHSVSTFFVSKHPLSE